MLLMKMIYKSLSTESVGFIWIWRRQPCGNLKCEIMHGYGRNPKITNENSNILLGNTIIHSMEIESAL